VPEKKQEKYISQKEFPENVVRGRIVVCDRRAAGQAQLVARLAPRLQLDHTTQHESSHLLLLICMSFDQQSAPTVPYQKKKKGKRKNEFTKRISRECCWWPNRRLQSTRIRTSTARCETGIPVATGPHNTARVFPPASADLHVVRPTIRTNQNAFSLCEKRKKEKRIHKKNSLIMLLVAESSFAIDAHQVKRSSLRDWRPCCNWTTQQSTSLPTCFC
jgi:hypothetical protein